ncbi:hypothetical protein SK128_015078 [Halocaridina rubra]|uniref:Uncharacterized protein n=1 Tax=Halocaridina rubra TaxID=373956 RepID=A0AAN8WMH7_HALRR
MCAKARLYYSANSENEEQRPEIRMLGIHPPATLETSPKILNLSGEYKLKILWYRAGFASTRSKDRFPSKTESLSCLLAGTAVIGHHSGGLGLALADEYPLY